MGKLECSGKTELHSQNEDRTESNQGSQASTLTRSHNYSIINPVFSEYSL